MLAENAGQVRPVKYLLSLFRNRENVGGNLTGVLQGFPQVCCILICTQRSHVVYRNAPCCEQEQRCTEGHLHNVRRHCGEMEGKRTCTK